LKTTNFFVGIFVGVAIAGCGASKDTSENSKAVVTPNMDSISDTAQNFRGGTPPPEKLIEPSARMRPLQLVSPATAQVGRPLAGVSVSLDNPGTDAPNSRLRLIIHETNMRHGAGHRGLSPENVKVEVQEGGSWKTVQLGMVEGGVMGAIGTEGVAVHEERHRRGGFAIPAGLNKTWQLRVTFDEPGTYTLVSAISPNNGSRHLAEPAHSIIEVK